MNLYADSIIDELEGANNKCMRDYKNLLKRSAVARSAIFRFSTERKIPIIIDYDGCRNYSVLPPVKEECSEEVLQELISTTSGEESGSIYKGNIQVLTVTPYSEEDMSDTYDDEYVSSEQEESCIEDYDIQYVPVGNISNPQYKTERFTSAHTSPKLEAKQGYTDLRYFLHGSNHYYERPRYADSDVHQYYLAQQFYAPPQEEEDERFYYYDDVHNQQYTSYPKDYRYVYEWPSIYAQEKCFSKKKPRYTYYLHQNYEIPQKYVMRSNTHPCRKPRRRKPTYSTQYYVQGPYSGPANVNHRSRAYFSPDYQKHPQYYYSPCYTSYPNEAHFGYSDYPQFQESERFLGPYENYQYVTYPEEDIVYY